MQFVTEERFVILCLSTLAIISVSYSIFSSCVLSPAIGILFMSYGMFAYTVVPLLGSDGLRWHWFKNPPPAGVSRITLLALFVICIAAAWRSRERLNQIPPRRLLLLVMIVCAPLASTALLYIPLQQRFTDYHNLQLKFSFVFSCFCVVAATSSVIFSMSRRPQLNHILLTIGLLIGAVTSVAFLEVAFDVASVQNMMRGARELRASSTFHNPNWFALAVAPGFFLASKVAHEGRGLAASALFGTCTLALILAASRSAIALVVLTMIVLSLALWRTGPRRREIHSLAMIAQSAGLGCIGGILAGLLASYAVGGTAPELYVALLDRVAAWPFYLASGDQQVWMSLEGRGIDLLEGRRIEFGVLDNAYLYWLQVNSITGILLISLMGSVLIFAIRNYVRSRSFENALRLSSAAFVVGGGMIGQVYWAFPVWLIFALVLGYVLQPLTQDWLCNPDAARAQR